MRKLEATKIYYSYSQLVCGSIFRCHNFIYCERIALKLTCIIATEKDLYKNQEQMILTKHKYEQCI